MSQVLSGYDTVLLGPDLKVLVARFLSFLEVDTAEECQAGTTLVMAWTSLRFQIVSKSQLTGAHAMQPLDRRVMLYLEQNRLPSHFNIICYIQKLEHRYPIIDSRIRSQRRRVASAAASLNHDNLDAAQSHGLKRNKLVDQGRRLLSCLVRD